MNTKICTSIEQSKKLLSLGLDPSTADMFYEYIGFEERLYAENPILWKSSHFDYIRDIPSWSLIVLLELMPTCINDDNYFLIIEKDETYLNEPIYRISYKHFMREDSIVERHSSLINAAFEMVCWLIEQGFIKVNK